MKFVVLEWVCHQPLDEFQLRGELQCHGGLLAQVAQRVLGGDPVLEGPRLLQLRGEDERVEAALVDDDRLLLATDGVVNHDPIPVFLIHMAVQRIAGVAEVSATRSSRRIRGGSPEAPEEQT